MNKISKIEFHPYTRGLPMMASHEIDALGVSLKEQGQLLPIMLFEGKIIDGRNRYLACERIGLEPKVISYSKGNPKEYAVVVNYFRKHWTTQERAHVAAMMSLESEVGNPDALIAPNGAIKATEPPVTQSEAAETMNVSRRSVQRAKSKIEGKDETKPTKTASSVAVDANGKTVPDQALNYWNRIPEANNVLNQIRAAKGQIKKLLPDDPMWAEVNLDGVMADLEAAINRFKAAVPSHVCPYCSGLKPDGCKTCKSRGVVSKFLWGMIPDEMKHK